MSTPSDDDLAIEATGLTVRFDGPNARPVLDGVELQISRGRVVSVLGRSGSGKTTLLRVLAGLQTSHGQLRIRHGQRSSGPPVGVVFQQPTLLPWRSGWENIALPLEIAGQTDRDRTNSQIAAALDAVRLSRFDAAKYPDQLSGGMQMRVAIARALVLEPTILLLDEPFAALDEPLRETLQDMLLDLCTARSLTVVFVTHSIREAIYLSDEVVVLQDGRLTGRRGVPLSRPRTRDMQRQVDFLGLEVLLAEALTPTPVLV